MDFEFSQPKNKKISSDDLILDLKNVANILKKTPSMREYNENGKYENSVFVRRFGSWNKALEKAGLDVFTGNLPYTELELFQNIEHVWIILGKQPSRRDMNREISKISSGAYIRHFKTWENALLSFVNYINNGDVQNKENPNISKSKKRTARDVNQGLRFRVMQRDNFKCCLCGRSPSSTPGLTLEIDHIVPYSKGGETVMNNLQTLCADCNRGKSDILLKKDI